MIEMMNLQLFDAVQSITNTTTGHVDSYSGNPVTTNALSPTMKEYYDTELLENARENLIFAQLGKKQVLPKNHGKIVEWRKWNTLGDADMLVEGVIPEGKGRMSAADYIRGRKISKGDHLE